MSDIFCSPPQYRSALCRHSGGESLDVHAAERPSLLPVGPMDDWALEEMRRSVAETLAARLRTFTRLGTANAQDFYIAPCMLQTTSTSSLPACRHPSHGRTNKTSCPSPCRGSTFLYPCCLSTYQRCLCSWSTLYSCATYNSTPYRNWCLLATKMFLDSLTPTIVPTEATTLLVSFISSSHASSQPDTCAPPNSLP